MGLLSSIDLMYSGVVLFFNLSALLHEVSKKFFNRLLQIRLIVIFFLLIAREINKLLAVK